MKKKQNNNGFPAAGELSPKEAAFLRYRNADLLEQYAAEYALLAKEAEQMELDLTALDNRMAGEINAAMQKAKRQARGRRFRKAGTIAAAVILALAITFGGLMKCSVAFRATVYEWFGQVDDKAANFEFGERQAVPENWQGKYAPTQLPEGFAITDVSVGDTMYLITYQDKTGHEVVFTCMKGNGAVSMDNEDGILTEVEINGSHGYLFNKPGKGCTVYWLRKEQGAYLEVYTNLSEEAALLVANSVDFIL